MLVEAFLLIVTTVTACAFLHKWIRSLKCHHHENKSVLITCCDSKIGKVLAVRLDELGFCVFAGCCTVESKKFLHKNSSHRLVCLALDSSSPESIRNVFKTLKNTRLSSEGFWALINTTDKLGLAAPCEMYTARDYLEIFDINLFGPIQISGCFLPMLRNAGGRIINVINKSSKESFTHCPYISSKLGLEGYSDMLRRETYRQGVKVCIVQVECSPQNDNRDKVESTLKKFNAVEAEVKQAYGGEFMQIFSKGLMLKEDCSSYQEKVLEAVVSAVTDRFPQTRYFVRKKSDRIVSRFMNFLPDWIVDKFHMLSLSLE